MIHPEASSRTGIMTIDREPMVFHCNHYNRFLQLVIEDCHYIERDPILVRSAAEVSFRQLRHAFQDHPEWSVKARLQYAEDLYRFCGFGDLPLAALPASADFLKLDAPFTLLEKHSHYGAALRLNYGTRRWPGEYFDRGFAIGALSAIYEQPITGEIGEALSMGAAVTQIQLHASTDGDRFPCDTPDIASAPLPAGADQVPARHIGLHIDEAAIMAAVGSLPLVGDEQGLIPAFGVYLTRHYADYYNLVSFRFEHALKDALSTHRYLGEMLWYEYPTLFYYKEKFQDLQGQALASTLLIEAGHICGFNTMGGIMRSDPWYQLIVPQLQCREDWLSGIIACINALGWGVWRIQEIVPNERLVLRAWYPYESLGYLRAYGTADHPIDYLMTGIGASLMNLLYTADITNKPELTLEFYYQVNRTKAGFWARQTRCVAMGDPYSEVVVERHIL